MPVKYCSQECQRKDWSAKQTILHACALLEALEILTGAATDKYMALLRQGWNPKHQQRSDLHLGRRMPEEQLHMQEYLHDIMHRTKQQQAELAEGLKTRCARTAAALDERLASDEQHPGEEGMLQAGYAHPHLGKLLQRLWEPDPKHDDEAWDKVGSTLSTCFNLHCLQGPYHSKTLLSMTKHHLFPLSLHVYHRLAVSTTCQWKLPQAVPMPLPVGHSCIAAPFMLLCVFKSWMPTRPSAF